MATIVWPGTPGETFANTTGSILYQFICSGINTCGTCWQYNLAVAKWWSKFHRGCNCISKPIYPGATSAPYEDFRDLIAKLPADQQKKVVGVANMQLIEAGVVEWSDVVTSNRVRLLREVVSREGLTVRDMTRAGVKTATAELAYQTVNTPDHVLAQQQRVQLVKQITDLGIKPQTLKEMFGDAMAQRIGIGSGPSGPSEIPPGKTDAQWIEIILMKGTRGQGPGASREIPPDSLVPRPESLAPPESLPQTVEEFAREATVAAQSVPMDLRYAETKVWISDAFDQFKKTYPNATLDDFKASLVAANIARLITLARFDLPGQVSKELRAKDDQSETKQGIATFNQIRLDKP